MIVPPLVSTSHSIDPRSSIMAFDDLATSQMKPVLHESIQAEIVAGVKLRPVPLTMEKTPAAGDRWVELLNNVINQRRSVLDMDSE